MYELNRNRFLRWCRLVKLTEEILFDFQIFHDGLNHQIGALDDRNGVCGGRNVLQDFLDELFTCLERAKQNISN